MSESGTFRTHSPTNIARPIVLENASRGSGLLTLDQRVGALASGVGKDPDPIPTARKANVSSPQAVPFRILPQRGPVCEKGFNFPNGHMETFSPIPKGYIIQQKIRRSLSVRRPARDEPKDVHFVTQISGFGSGAVSGQPELAIKIYGLKE